MEREKIKKFAQELHFTCTDEEIDEIALSFDALEKQLIFFEQIDTSDVSEMVYPLDTITSFLREDVISHVLSQEEVLLNVAEEKEGHIVVPKVLH